MELKNQKTLVLILGDQLFPPSFWKPYRDSEFIVIESRELCTHFRYHQQKIVFFLSAMRSFRDEMVSAGFRLNYRTLEETGKEAFLDILGKYILSEKISRLRISLVNDRFLEVELKKACRQWGVELELLPTKYFITSRPRLHVEISDTDKRPFMKRFYESQRTHFKILLDEKGKPEGGKWSYDVENRKKIPKNLPTPSFPKFPRTKHTEDLIQLVAKEFRDHPGHAEDFWLPTERKEAERSLMEFVLHRLDSFGPFEDGMDPRSPFWFHSVLSPMMNNGLLQPREVITTILKAYEAGHADLHSVEGIIRQILGWREFIYGIDRYYHEQFTSSNFWGHDRPLPAAWMTATMGIPPLDDTLKKVERYGYAHHIERLMVLANFQNLLQVKPGDAYRWFMENFVDSADWVMGPNVFCMGLMSDGGIFATKPYLCSSNYLLKMSNYEKGDWCEIVDALYWGFIGRNAEFFAGNPRLGMMSAQYRKMPDEKRSRLEEVENRAIKSWYPKLK